jgi:hypothetical protein
MRVPVSVSMIFTSRISISGKSTVLPSVSKCRSAETISISTS